MALDIIGLLYAAFLIYGGIQGYNKVGSTASLVTGVGFGSVIGITSHWGANKSSTYYAIPLVCCALLVGIMGSRYATSQRFMPAGMLAISGLVMMVRFLIKLI